MRRMILLIALMSGVLACNAPLGRAQSGKTSIAPPAKPSDSATENALGWETYDEQEPIHIELDAPHEPYNSDPPTSGPHYPQPAPAGLYDEIVPDGYLIHSMEHGYVIIWYDCSVLSDDDCADLQLAIYEVIQDHDEYKIIGAPREGMPTLLALTSWTNLARLDEFDRDFIEEFIDANQNQAPEPDAP